MAIFIPNTSGVNVAVAWSGPITTSITMMCWVYLSGSTPAAFRGIISAEPNLFLGTYSDGVTMDSGTYSYDFTGPVLPTNQWIHMCLVATNTDATTEVVRGYWNGNQLSGNTATGESFSSYTGFTIGNFVAAGDGQPLNGKVYNVKIWARALTPTEIFDEIYSNNPESPGCLIWSTFNNDIYTTQNGAGYTWAATGAGQLVTAGPLLRFPRRFMTRP